MNAHLSTLNLTILSPFSQLVSSPTVSSPTWQKAQFLCVVAILCQGIRRISSILRVMGIVHNKEFEKCRRFLNRDEWNPLMGAKILFGLLVSLVPLNQTLLIVFDDTIERRKGRTIKAKGKTEITHTELLCLKLFHDMKTFEQIGELLSLPIQTVKARHRICLLNAIILYRMIL